MWSLADRKDVQKPLKLRTCWKNINLLHMIKTRWRRNVICVSWSFTKWGWVSTWWDTARRRTLFASNVERGSKGKPVLSPTCSFTRESETSTATNVVKTFSRGHPLAIICRISTTRTQVYAVSVEKIVATNTTLVGTWRDTPEKRNTPADLKVARRGCASPTWGHFMRRSTPARRTTTAQCARKPSSRGLGWCSTWRGTRGSRTSSASLAEELLLSRQGRGNASTLDKAQEGKDTKTPKVRSRRTKIQYSGVVTVSDCCKSIHSIPYSDYHTL